MKPYKLPHWPTADEIVEAFDGNTAAAARGIGVTREAIYQWKKKGGPIPSRTFYRLVIENPELFEDPR